MPDDRARILDDYITGLKEAWKLTGSLSFKELERLSSRFVGQPHPSGVRVIMLAHSTTQQIFTRKRAGLPKWRWVASLHIVLRAAAVDAGTDPDRLGTRHEWKARHEAAEAALLNVTRAVPEPARDLLGTPQAISHEELRRAEAILHAVDLYLPGASDENAKRAIMLALAGLAIDLAWWHEYRDVVPSWFAAYLSLEPAASLIRTYETRFVPGLLQTPEYARTVIRLSNPHARDPEIQRRVELRMRRQKMLHRPNAPKFWAIVDEAALRRQLGGRAMMRSQIRHLIYISQKPNITIQIMPGRSKGNAVAGGPITSLRFPDRDLPDVVYLEQLTGALYPNTDEDIYHYIQVLSRLGIEANQRATTVAALSRILTEPNE